MTWSILCGRQVSYDLVVSQQQICSCFLWPGIEILAHIKAREMWKFFSLHIHNGELPRHLPMDAPCTKKSYSFFRTMHKKQTNICIFLSKSHIFSIYQKRLMGVQKSPSKWRIGIKDDLSTWHPCSNMRFERKTEYWNINEKVLIIVYQGSLSWVMLCKYLPLL